MPALYTYRPDTPGIFAPGWSVIPLCYALDPDSIPGCRWQCAAPYFSSINLRQSALAIILAISCLLYSFGMQISIVSNSWLYPICLTSNYLGNPGFVQVAYRHRQGIGHVKILGSVRKFQDSTHDLGHILLICIPTPAGGFFHGGGRVFVMGNARHLCRKDSRHLGFIYLQAGSGIYPDKLILDGQGVGVVFRDHKRDRLVNHLPHLLAILFS